MIRRQVPFSELVTDVILFSVEHLQTYTENLFCSNEVDENQFLRKSESLSNLLLSGSDEFVDVALDAMSELTEKNSHYIETNDDKNSRSSYSQEAIEATIYQIKETSSTTSEAISVQHSDPHHLQGDLAFFQELIHRIEASNPGWRGRGALFSM